MANASVFTSVTPTTVNDAGGVAYSMSAKEALAQFAVTGCFNDTFYASADSQVDKVLELASQVSPEYIAKLALYSRTKTHMKDMPALLTTLLVERDIALFERIAPKTIDNGKMVRNLVQMVRSGKAGKKNLARPVRRFIKNWLNSRSSIQLVNESVGNNPSLADVIKMVHPRPTDASRAALFAYLIDKPHNPDQLPEEIRQLETLKAGGSAKIPKGLDFRLLDSLPLNTSDWEEISMGMGWHALRMNLNTLERKGVFRSDSAVKKVANRLRDEKLISKSRVLPYQLYSTLLNTESLPTEINLALQDALELSIDNVPAIDGQVIVCPDLSGSMSMSVTGYRYGATSKVSCFDVAALVASAVLRKNPTARVIGFSDRIHDDIKLNPRDSVFTNAKKISSSPGGGTDIALPMEKILKDGLKPDVVWYVSDNESWRDRSYRSKPELSSLWEQYTKKVNKSAKLVLNDIVPNSTTQAKNSKNVYNVGGFSDAVFDFVASVSTKRQSNWVDTIESTVL